MAVDWSGGAGSVTLNNSFLQSNLTVYMNTTAFYFQLEWSDNQAVNTLPGTVRSYYSYSPLWAVVKDNDTETYLLGCYGQLKNYTEAYKNQTSTPAVQPYAMGTSTSTATTTPSGSSPNSTTPSSQNASQDKGLSTGAIVGIAVGGFAFLVLLSLGAGCLCLRHRRSKRGADSNHYRRDANRRDLMAEKEAHVIMETAPDTPYSERDETQHAMPLPKLQLLQHHSSLSLSKLGKSRVAVGAVGDVGGNRGSDFSGIASGIGNGNDGSSIHANHNIVHVDNGGDDQGELEHESMISSPVGSPSSSQQERSFPLYTDQPPTDYSQHHRVVDGADLVQQEQSNSKGSSNRNNVAGGNNGEQQQKQHQPGISSSPSDPAHPAPSETGNNSNNNSAHSSPELRPAGSARARARSTTPSGISGRYAHLIEDGMTDEEIRRMEEEERALDEAIEQNRTGRATPRI